MKEKESACWHGYQNSLQENGAFERDIKVVIDVSRNNKLRVGARQTGIFSEKRHNLTLEVIKFILKQFRNISHW